MNPVIKPLTRGELAQIAPLAPMIGGVLNKGTVVMLAAQPAAGKSFLAVDWCCSYITGRTWQGHEVNNTVTYPDDRPAKGAALIIAGEGARGMSSRVTAWEQAWKQPVPDQQFRLLPHPVQLGSAVEVEALIEHVKSETYGLIVFDTVARCTRGMEENSSSDMGRVIDTAYRVRDAMGPDGTVLLVHHLGKGGTVRGSSALLGGVDQLIRLERDGERLELYDEKRKDGRELTPISLRLKPFHDSCVIEAHRGDASDSSVHRLVAAWNSAFSAIGSCTKTEFRAVFDGDDRTFLTALNQAIRQGLIEASNERNPRYRVTPGVCSSATAPLL